MCGSRSEQMKSLDGPLHYNYELWLTHYMMHLNTVETLHNIGDPTELSVMEMNELMHGADQFSSFNQETGNLSPQDVVENSTVVRLGTQFSWGSRYAPPFCHSNDSINSVVASLAKLGK